MKAILTLLLIINIGYCQLIQTHWHESYPYNQNCPQIEGTNTYAGNRSVAVAQLINYWGHPNVGYGEITYSNLWTDSIYCQFYQLYFPCETEGQIANLIFSAGASCKHQFSPYMQNSLCDVYNLDTIAKGLHDYFGYKEGVITSDQQQIIEAIQEDHPIILESYPLPPSLGCARYFLLDGYSDGLFHVNNSFGGMFDGWYPIDEILFLNVYYGTNYRALITEPDSMIIEGMVLYEGSLEAITGSVSVDNITVNIQDGYFSIEVPRGLKCITINVDDVWAKCNATDALLLLEKFVGMVSFEGLKDKTSFIDNNNITNSNDALLVVKRFIGDVNSFPLSDFVYDNVCVENDSTVVIHVRFRGDVNP